MSKVNSTKSFIEKAIEINKDKFDYSKVEYINSNSEIEILCKKHNVWFKQIPYVHLRGGLGACKMCLKENLSSKKLIGLDEFLNRVKKKHGDKYLYKDGGYNGLEKKINMICKEHGGFTSAPVLILKCFGCSKCAGTFIQCFEDFKNESAKKFGNKFKYLEYKDTQHKCKLSCVSHGEFYIIPSNHLKSKTGCTKCSHELVSKNMTKSQEQFLKEAKEVHKNKYTYDKVIYKHSDIKIIITCGKHGDFEQEPGTHLVGRGCEKCSHSISNLETEWLDYLKIPNDKYHRNVSIRVGKKLFRVDGFDPETNMIYEFNGDVFHGNPVLYQRDGYFNLRGTTFGELHDKTIEKQELLESAGYTVISIWESDWKE